MQLRVVSDQPWDVAADVLVVPFVGELEFEGSLGEIDRRSGGELHAIADFGELKSERYSAVILAPGQLRAGRLMVVAAGPADELTRQIVIRTASTVERRLGGRHVKSLAIWLGDLADRIEGGAEAVAELLARGVVEGSFEPAGIYRDEVKSAPPALDELILVAPGASPAALTRAAERGVIIGEGANLARRLANRAANDVSPGRPRAGGPRHRRAARPYHRRDSARRRPRSWAWACSSPSAAAATTRRE
jgi:leucyl aminopeptidase